MNLSPLPIQKFFDNDGKPLVGGQLFTYIAGTTTKLATYKDQAGTLNTNPVVLDYRGEANVWLDQTLTYKFVLAPAGDTDPPTKPIWTVDNISAAVTYASLTAQIIGQILYPRTAAEIAAGATIANYALPELWIDRYGVNTTPGTTDMTAAIRTCLAVVAQHGGGEMQFLPAVYLLATTSFVNVIEPVSGPNFQPSTTNMQYHFYMNNVDNVHWNLNGATLKSSITNGGTVILGDGVRNFSIDDGIIQSVTAKDGTGAVTVAGMHAMAFTSQTRDSYNIKVSNVIGKNVYAAFYAFGDTASAFRVRDITIDTFYHDQGIYTIALHDNGDNCKVTSAHSSNTLREAFVFGADCWDIQMSSDTGVAGFSSVIKAYDRDTRQGKYFLRTTKNISECNVVIQSQHAPAVQPIPKRVIECIIDVNNQGTTGLGPAVGFQYYRDLVLTANAVNNYCTGIILRGVHEQAPQISSTQTGTAAGTLNVDGVVLLNGAMNSLFDSTGFYDTKNTYGNFTPAITINGSAVGITYTSQLGDFWREGRFINFFVDITLSNKGASVGVVALTGLPFTSAGSVANALISGQVVSNGAGITGPLTGFVVSPATTANILQQGAAAVASLTDANLTNTTRFRINGRYPINL